MGEGERQPPRRTRTPSFANTKPHEMKSLSREQLTTNSHG